MTVRQRWMVSLIGMLTLLSFTAPGAIAGSPAAPAVAEPVHDTCAPPCGYVNPIIGLDPDVAFPYKTSKLPGFPHEINLKVTYWWDFDQDGTGVPGGTEDMEIVLALTKQPDWINAKLEPTMCSFTLIPTTTEYDVCTVTLTTEVTDYPMTEAALEEFGKRMMVFATSKESGTYRQSYGAEDMRFKFDEAPDVDGGLFAHTDKQRTAEAPLGVVAPLAALGAAAIVVRRRS